MLDLKGSQIGTSSSYGLKAKWAKERESILWSQLLKNQLPLVGGAHVRRRDLDSFFGRLFGVNRIEE